MSGEVIEYHSEECKVRKDTDVLETKSQNGITCTWSGKLVDGVKSIKYTWKFNWDEMMKEKEFDIDKITGYILARRTTLTAAENVRFDVELTKENQTVERTIVNANGTVGAKAAFDYHLIIHQTPIYENMFSASDKTDAILVIDGKKIHVNKAFLSFHSDFFTALFSSNFKEGQLTEIPIKDVSFEDFGLLMSTIYPKKVFPDDYTAEKLLELADRFLMPFVTNLVEFYLLNLSKLENEKMMWMADAYGMPELFKKCIRAIDTVEKAKKLKASPEYAKLSKDAKITFLEQFTQLI